jgi:hypothetical protein
MELSWIGTAESLRRLERAERYGVGGVALSKIAATEAWKFFRRAGNNF